MISMYQKFFVRMLNGDDYCSPLEVVERSLKIGCHEFGWVSYKGQRCKVTAGNVGDGAHFEAVYYPSRGKWR